MAIKNVRCVEKNLTKKLNTPPGTTAANSLISGTIVYDVFLESPDDVLNPLEILSDKNLPQVGDKYAENTEIFSGIYFAKADPKYDGYRDGSPVIRISYTLEGDDFKATPENEVQLVSMSTSHEFAQWARPMDLDGKWNTNSIGEFFAEPFNIAYRKITFKWKFKEYHNPFWKYEAFTNKINIDNTWGLFAPATLKCNGVNWSSIRTNKQAYWDVDYEIQFNPAGWHVERADAGFYAYNDNNQLMRLLNEDGSPLDSPMLLNGFGHVLPRGLSPVTRQFRVYEWANFGGLGLPSPATDLDLSEF